MDERKTIYAGMIGKRPVRLDQYEDGTIRITTLTLTDNIDPAPRPDAADESSHVQHQLTEAEEAGRVVTFDNSEGQAEFERDLRDLGFSLTAIGDIVGRFPVSPDNEPDQT